MTHAPEQRYKKNFLRIYSCLWGPARILLLQWILLSVPQWAFSHFQVFHGISISDVYCPVIEGLKQKWFHCLVVCGWGILARLSSHGSSRLCVLLAVTWGLRDPRSFDSMCDASTGAAGIHGRQSSLTFQMDSWASSGYLRGLAEWKWNLSGLLKLRYRIDIVALLLCTVVVVVSHPVVSDSLWTHGLLHARPPCPWPSPEVCPSLCLCISDAVQSSHPLTPFSPSALSLSQCQGLFQ